MDFIEDVPNDGWHKKKQAQFEDKVLVCWTISEDGISRPYVGPFRGESLNADSCKERFVNFIKT